MKNLRLILLVIFAIPLMLDAQSVIRGPYLQNGGTDHVTIRWRTDQPTQSKVNIGNSFNNLTIPHFDAAFKTDHEIEITNLNPNTIYYYNIETETNVLVNGASDLYFKTAPSNGTTDSYKFWVLGDCGTGGINARNVRDAYYNHIGDQHTDGILFLGDNAYVDGTDSEYQTSVFENMYEDKLKNTISWSALGNHDGHSANSSSQTGPYYDIFTLPTDGGSGGIASGTEAYYSFDYGNIHFICLDSYDTDRSVGEAMYSWCENDIQNTSQEWIVAFWHHPPYSKGSHDSDRETPLREMRQNYLPMLEDNGVDLVLSGHSHSYERSFFINGHYGKSETFTPDNLVGNNGGGDGKFNGNGAYLKDGNGFNANAGAVYITAGSSGQVTEGTPLNHKAMYYSVAALGSCLLEVENDKMDVKFIEDNGNVSDYFSIQKVAVGCNIGTACDDQDPCTFNDVWNTDCNCEGTPGVDTDNDGVCDSQDCQIFDPFFPNVPGNTCDDGNASTPFDLVLADGCSCAGFFEMPCIVEVSVANNIITIGGIPSDANAQIFDQNWDSIWDCNPWSPGSDCNPTETYVAENGIYNVKVISEHCDFSQQVAVNSITTGCPDNDNDGVCGFEDCNDADPNLPAPINSPCNDGNSATENDVIQSDGCTCLGVTAQACNITVTSNEGVITITGAAGTNTKIFSLDWEALWACNPWVDTPCSNLETYQSGPGTFYVSSISNSCDFFFTIEVGGGTVTGCTDNDNDGICAAEDCDDTNPNLPTTINTPCNDGNPATANDVIQPDGCTCLGVPVGNCNITVTSNENAMSISGAAGNITKVFSLDWEVLWECNTWSDVCSNVETYQSGLGTFYVSSVSNNCDFFSVVSVTGGDCADSDQDGICDNADCAPLDSTIPSTPNSPCNDGDPATENDIIQSDGCTCMGTTIDSDCNFTYSVGANSISFSELSDDIITLNLFGSNNAEIFTCGTWNTPCNTTELVSNLSPGTYRIYYQSYDLGWNNICDLQETISIGTNISLDVTNQLPSNTFIKSSFHLFPNPTKNRINLDLTNLMDKRISVEIYDLLGKKVYSRPASLVTESVLELDLSHFNNGIYNLTIFDGDKKYENRTFVIAK